jgi:hypothetical protein
MRCEYKDCQTQATVMCRFGDGTYDFERRRAIKVICQQTFVRYCDQHWQIIDRLFVTCDLSEAAHRPRAIDGQKARSLLHEHVAAPRTTRA